MSSEWTQPIRRGASCHVTIQYSKGTNGEGDFSGHVYCLFNSIFYLSFVNANRILIAKRGENLRHRLNPTIKRGASCHVTIQYSKGTNGDGDFSGHVYCLFNSIFYLSFAHAYRIPIIQRGKNLCVVTEPNYQKRTELSSHNSVLQWDQ